MGIHVFEEATWFLYAGLLASIGAGLVNMRGWRRILKLFALMEASALALVLLLNTLEKLGLYTY